MACSVVRSAVLRNPTVRHYAAAAAARARTSPGEGTESEVLKNNVIVAVAQQDHPISHVSIVFRAGPRNETYDTQGLCHHLRITAGMSTKKHSAFGITRNIQQLGGTLTATIDRETIAYTLMATRDHVCNALSYLAETATKNAFNQWELDAQLARLRYEVATVPETTRVLELLHKVAYRTGLGYSLYSPKYQLGKFNCETLQHFVNNWFIGSRCAVVGTGIAKETLVEFATSLEFGNGSEAKDCQSKFCGGEVRKERYSELATVAVATEGACLKNEKETLAFAVLQRAAGVGPRVKWGSSQAPLYAKVASAAKNVPFALTSLNASYSDSGLFGFILSAPGSHAGDLTKAAYEWLKSPNVTDSDICHGKAALKTEVLSSAEYTPCVVDDLAQQALMRCKVANASAIISQIDKLTTADVQAVICKISGKPIAMASMGDLSTVPYKDQLN